MSEGPRDPGPPERIERTGLSRDEQRRMLRAASLRPINVLVVVVGVLAIPLVGWWMVPLTLLTYAALVLLAARDPVYQSQVLPGRDSPRLPSSGAARQVPPERRARWLPRGETRRKVEAALVVYRKVVAAIEESDDVTRAVLEDTVPRLHAAANRLVDVAEGRERAAEVVEEHRDGRTSATTAESSPREADLRRLEERIQAADAEVSETLDQWLDLRAKVVRVSLESGDPDSAAAFNASLDELNARLEALSETVSPRGRLENGS
ncbi:MAG TPA: hypothetical protein VK869_08285 [Rubrobacteraceae bacterium]|nr:hypothetical protein [Rubrobacteraceae bacterium]